MSPPKSIQHSQRVTFVYTVVPPRSMTNTSYSWQRQPKNMLLSSTVLSIASGSLRLLFMVQGSLPMACDWITPKSKPFLHLTSDLPRTDKLPSALYFRPFHQTMFLHEQLATWEWNPSTDAAFQHLKAWICQTLLNATLVYYDRYKPVIQTQVSMAWGMP